MEAQTIATTDDAVQRFLAFPFDTDEMYQVRICLLIVHLASDYPLLQGRTTHPEKK